MIERPFDKDADTRPSGRSGIRPDGRQSPGGKGRRVGAVHSARPTLGRVGPMIERSPTRGFVCAVFFPGAFRLRWWVLARFRAAVLWFRRTRARGRFRGALRAVTLRESPRDRPRMASSG